MSGSAYADKYVGPHTHGQPAPSDYVYVEKGPNSVWHEPADPLFMAKTWEEPGKRVRHRCQVCNTVGQQWKDLRERFAWNACIPGRGQGAPHGRNYVCFL
jgi:hypothetical protein